MDNQTIYIVKGIVTDDDAHESASIGDVEWQFSDGPPGQRSGSADYVSLEKGLREHSGKRFVFWEVEEDE